MVAEDSALTEDEVVKVWESVECSRAIDAIVQAAAEWAAARDFVVDGACGSATGGSAGRRRVGEARGAAE